jgi:hypothetical protein
MRVLITNITLAGRTGTEINVRDVACGLQARGHTPVVYSPALGEIADELRARTIPVVDDLAKVGGCPDVIHGHHHPETMAACLRFPGVPAIFFSHDFTAWHDAAPRFPRIRRYVAVDEANRDRLLLAGGIAAERIRVVLNAVDLGRFTPRGPLPPVPRRALVFSHYAGEHPHDRAVRAACDRIGLPLDVVGKGVGAVSRTPEELLGRYDLVFAKGRSALEALAVGCAVVLVDFAGSGPMVTAAALDSLRRNNFGRRLLVRPLDPDLLAAEVARYDADDATRVAAAIRATAGLDAQLDTLDALYREVVDEEAACGSDVAAELRAASAYVREWCPRAEDRRLWEVLEERAAAIVSAGAERDEAWRAAEQAAREVAQARAEREAAHAAHREFVAARAVLEAEHQALAREARGLEAEAVRLAVVRDRLTEERDRLAAECARLTGELAYVHDSPTWRLHARLLRSRFVVSLYRALRRLVRRRPADVGRAPQAAPDGAVAMAPVDQGREPLRPNA